MPDEGRGLTDGPRLSAAGGGSTLVAAGASAAALAGAGDAAVPTIESMLKPILGFIDDDEDDVDDADDLFSGVIESASRRFRKWWAANGAACTAIAASTR